MTLSNGRWHAAALLIAIAVCFLILPVYRGFFPLEIATVEGWNAYHQDAAIAGDVLYPPRDSLIGNNYPPLSFYAIGGLASLTGSDALYVGRVVSVVATLGLGVAIAAIVIQLGGGAYAAVIAATWFVATMARAFNDYVGMNDPQLSGQLIMACALLWFLRRNAARKAPEPAILLMAVAGFWKHNIVTIPLASLLWLVLQDWRRAIRPCLVGIGGVCLGLVICVALYGNVFLVDLLAPRRFDVARILTGIGRLQWIAPALAIWAFWAWYARETVAARFTALLIGIGLAIHLLQWSGEAVLNNSQFDLTIATAIGLGLAFSDAAPVPLARRWGVDGVHAAAVAVLAVRLLATGRIEPALIVFDPGYRAEFHAHTALVRQEAARVAAIPGPVGCDIKVVCRMAGKAFVVDDFKIEEMLATGAVSPAGLFDLMRRGSISYVAIDPRTRAESLNRDLFARGGR